MSPFMGHRASFLRPELGSSGTGECGVLSQGSTGGKRFMAENVRFHVGSGGRARGRRPISVTVANLQQLGITQPYPEGVSRPRAATAWAQRYLTTAIAMDVAITIVGFCVAYYLRFGPNASSDLPLLLAAPVLGSASWSSAAPTTATASATAPRSTEPSGVRRCWRSL